VRERVVGINSACFGRMLSEVLGKARVCPSAWLGLLVVQEWWLVRAGGTRPMQTRVSDGPDGAHATTHSIAWRGVVEVQKPMARMPVADRRPKGH
jgi:hypothetical protein